MTYIFFGTKKALRTVFLTFFKIGLFTFGGGYAMIPLFEREVVDRRYWLDRKGLLDAIAIAQSCPGVFAINVSIFVGYKLNGLRGALSASIGCALPSLIIILLVAIFFHQFRDNPFVAAMLSGLRPAAVALVAVPAFKLIKNVRIGKCAVLFLVGIPCLICGLKVSPVIVITASLLIGWAYHYYKMYPNMGSKNGFRARFKSYWHSNRKKEK